MQYSKEIKDFTKNQPYVIFRKVLGPNLCHSKTSTPSVQMNLNSIFEIFQMLFPVHKQLNTGKKTSPHQTTNTTPHHHTIIDM